MNKVLEKLIEQIIDLRIENKKYLSKEYNNENKLKALENINNNLKQEITNLRLAIDELTKEKKGSI
jgi:flagellar motor switch/type III secretory pathway protein FliN